MRPWTRALGSRARGHRGRRERRDAWRGEVWRVARGRRGDADARGRARWMCLKIYMTEASPARRYNSMVLRDEIDHLPSGLARRLYLIRHPACLGPTTMPS